MKKVFIILLFTLFLSSCSGKATPQPAAITSAFLPSATFSSTPLLIATSTATATSTVTPTPQPIFKAGIPEKETDCNALDLQLKPDGSIDGAWLTEKLKDLSSFEYVWLQQQGITVETIGTFIPSGQGILPGNAFPYSYLDISSSVDHNVLPTSCTRFTFQGNEYVMYGFAGKRSADSKTIAIIHGVYDFVGLNEILISSKNQPYYNSHYTPELIFQYMHNTTDGKWPFNDLSFFLGGYSDDASQFSTWKLSHALMTANDIPGNVEQGGTPYLVRYLYGFEKYTPTAEEDAQWAAAVEQYAYPLKVIVPPIN